MRSISAGLVANGFTEILEDQRSDRRLARGDAAETIQRFVRDFIERRRFLREVAMAKKDAKRRGTYVSEVALAKQTSPWFKLAVLNLIRGCCFKNSMITLILLNIVAVLVESDPYAKSYFGGAAFDRFELVSVLIFTLEYVARIWTANLNSHYWYSRSKYILSFYGMADVIAILPFYLEVVLLAR